MIVGVNTLAILVAHADSTVVEQRKILPYLEAEGEVGWDAPSMAWVNSEKIIFSTYTSSESYRREELADKIIHHFDEGSQVVIFNVNTKKTEFYRKGKFSNSIDGVVTILLKDVIVKGASSENYRELLKGSLGSEVPETYYQHKQPKPPRRCPSDKEESLPQGSPPIRFCLKQNMVA